MFRYFPVICICIILLGSTCAADNTVSVGPSRDYVNFCASCHGVNGDGEGKAARFLFPKPRSFIKSPLQFATTTNRISSASDIELVIRRGIPNTSMTGWPTLTDTQITTLVADVMRFRQAGAKVRFLRLLTVTGDITSSDTPLLTPTQQKDMGLYISKETKPGATWSLPRLPEERLSISRGLEVYKQQNCHKCHGEDARGSYGIDIVGEYGFPTFASDLVNDAYKYGRDRGSITRVIQLGINGTKMPASSTLTIKQLSDLTEYIISIQNTESTPLTNSQRYQRAIGNLNKSP